VVVVFSIGLCVMAIGIGSISISMSSFKAQSPKQTTKQSAKG
jgi:hypothetical protein